MEKYSRSTHETKHQIGMALFGASVLSWANTALANFIL